MTPQELTIVVGRIQTGDNRTVDRVTMAHWQETIGELDYQDALAAVVTHFRESTAYLLPAHIIANVKRIREQRAMTTGYSELDKTPAPAPKNLEAMSKAWNNPVELAKQKAVYNQQLINEGYPPLYIRSEQKAESSRL